jgi:hypothetical protein
MRIILIVIQVLTLVGASPAVGRPQDRSKFGAVPEDTRDRFVQRLILYIKYELKQNTEGLQTLYDAKTLCTLCRGSQECVDDCLPAMPVDWGDIEGFTQLRLRVLGVQAAKYRPNALEISPEQEQRIERRNHKPRNVKSKVRVYAIFERDDWYFSLVTVGGYISL